VKNLSDEENVAPRESLSATSSFSSTLDENPDNQLSSSSLADEDLSRRASKLFNEIYDDSARELPNSPSPSVDEDYSKVTGAKPKTHSNTESKHVGAGEATIGDRVDNLWQRLDVSDNQLTSLQKESEREIKNNDLSSFVLGAWPSATSDADDIMAETFPATRPRKPRRRTHSRGRPAAPERGLTWTAGSAPTLEDFGYEIHNTATEPPRMPERTGTWVQDKSNTSVERSCKTADGSTAPESHAPGIADNAPATLPCADDVRTMKTPVDVTRNSKPRGAETSSYRADLDDFELVEDLTDMQNVEYAARKMYRRWEEIVDGYKTMLARRHSDASMARRLTDLRRMTATLIDAQLHLHEVVNSKTMCQMKAIRLRAEWLRRQVMPEPGRQEWMVRRAESELSMASQVAAAFRLCCDEFADKRTDNSQYYDSAIGTLR